MDYKFLAKKALEKLFEETDLSVGEIIRTLVQEKVSGLKATNRGALTSITDKEWYSKIEKINLEESNPDVILTNEEWETFVENK